MTVAPLPPQKIQVNQTGITNGREIIQRLKTPNTMIQIFMNIDQLIQKSLHRQTDIITLYVYPPS